MKNCPYCQAEIQDNARFCLYCMKPLTEKHAVTPFRAKRRFWLPILVGLVVLIALLWLFFAFGKDEKQPEQTQNAAPDSVQSPTPTESTPSTLAPESTDPESTDPSPEPCTHSYTLTNSQPATCTTQGLDTYTCTSCGDSYDQAVDATGHQYAAATCLTAEICQVCEITAGAPLGHSYQDGFCIRCSQPDNTQAVYTYRTATAYDDYDIHYVNPETDIVITGLQTPSADGVYRIPDTIDGKRVVAIMANAFSGSNATHVYLPTTVKSIWDNAFANCPLTDIYFTHNTYIEANAFPDSRDMLTIHCPRDCHNRSFYTYRTHAESYGAVWEEWNGL